MPNSITILFFISVIVGIVLVIISLILGAKRTEKIELDQYDSATEKQNELIKVIEDADDAIEQLNSISKSIFEEQEQKYQELLYLYQIIDNNKQELLNMIKKVKFKDSENTLDETIKDENIKTDDIKNIETNFSSNPIHNQIIDLYNSGKSVTQIAQQLNIGQGEVNLVLELSKRGETHL